MSKFELSETPTLENTTAIINDAKKITSTPKTITGKTSVLKIMLNKTPFYHFVNKEFDSELATRQQDVVIDGKRFYMGLKNNSMHTRLRLASV